MIIRTVLVAGAIAAGITAAAAQEAVKARKDVMGAMAKPYYGVLARMNRGQAPFDAAAANAGLSTIAGEIAKDRCSVCGECHAGKEVRLRCVSENLAEQGGLRCQACGLREGGGRKQEWREGIRIR